MGLMVSLETMTRNILIAFLAACLGAGFFSFWTSLSQNSPSQGKTQSAGSQDGLTLIQIRDLLRDTPWAVPVSVVGTRDRIVTIDEVQEKVVELGSANVQPRAVLVVKGELSFVIDAEDSSGAKLEIDEAKKIAKITLPSPRFMKVGDSPKEVAFILGPLGEGELEATRNDAISTLPEAASIARGNMAARGACAAQLTAVAKAFGLKAEIIWIEPAPQAERRGAL